MRSGVCPATRGRRAACAEGLPNSFEFVALLVKAAGESRAKTLHRPTGDFQALILVRCRSEVEPRQRSRTGRAPRGTTPPAGPLIVRERWNAGVLAGARANRDSLALAGLGLGAPTMPSAVASWRMASSRRVTE